MNTKKHFTLIELLVVIVIITILAGMVLPALSKAKETARGAQCLSNLKQVCLYTLQYTNENNDFLPNGKIKRSDGDVDYAMRSLHRTIFPDQTFRFGDFLTDGYGNRKGKAKDFAQGNIICPNVNTKWAYGTGNVNSYGANIGVMGQGNDSGPSLETLGMIKLKQVMRPSQAYIWGEQSAMIIEPHKTDPELVLYRHNRRVTMGFADGHVEQKPQTLKNRGTSKTINGKAHFMNGAHWFYNGIYVAD